MKKVAIPVKNDQLEPHFGRSSNFVVFDIEDKKIIHKNILKAPPHQPGHILHWLADNNITDVLVGGIGQKAIDILYQYGVNVYAGVKSDNTDQVIKDFLNDSLAMGVNLCDH